MLVWLMLVGCGGGASDVDDTAPGDTDLEQDTDTGAQDTDTGSSETPIVDLRGAWLLGGRDLFPEQGDVYEDWAHAQQPEDYPELADCLPCADRFTLIVQGLRFEDDGGLVHTFDFSVGRCDPIDEIVECHVERPYGAWTFKGNSTSGDRALYSIYDESREWEAFPISDYVRAYEGTRSYTLYHAE